jgi:hypothetical protein
MQTHWNTAIHIDGYLYGSSGRHAGGAELRCIKVDTGEVMWSQPGLYRSSLLHIDGHLVCLSEYGPVILIKVDPQKYHPLAMMTFKDKLGNELVEYPAWAAPVVSHGLMYIQGQGRLLCMELIPRKPQ